MNNCTLCDCPLTTLTGEKPRLRCARCQPAYWEVAPPRAKKLADAWLTRVKEKSPACTR